MLGTSLVYISKTTGCVQCWGLQIQDHRKYQKQICNISNVAENVGTLVFHATWARPPSSNKRLKMVEFNLFNITILYHSANGATRETADTTLRRGGRCSTHGVTP